MTAEPTKSDSVKAAMRRFFPIDVLRALEIKRHKEAMAALDTMVARKPRT